MNQLIVIGGSRGLGRALVEVFAENSWSVHEFSRTGKTPYNEPLDLVKPLEANDVFSNYLKSIDDTTIKKIVLILNSAVILPIRKAANLTTEEIMNNLSINVNGALLVCASFLHHFRNLDRPKYLVNIGSGAAHRGFPGWSLYCAGKAATESFFRAIHEEEKTEKFPFHVFNYDPHIMDTRMQEEIRSASETDFPIVDQFRNFHANGQLTPPERVARNIYALIEAERSYQNRHEFLL